MISPFYSYLHIFQREQSHVEEIVFPSKSILVRLDILPSAQGGFKEV